MCMNIDLKLVNGQKVFCTVMNQKSKQPMTIEAFFRGRLYLDEEGNILYEVFDEIAYEYYKITEKDIVTEGDKEIERIREFVSSCKYLSDEDAQQVLGKLLKSYRDSK